MFHVKQMTHLFLLTNFEILNNVSECALIQQTFSPAGETERSTCIEEMDTFYVSRETANHVQSTFTIKLKMLLRRSVYLIRPSIRLTYNNEEANHLSGIHLHLVELLVYH